MKISLSTVSTRQHPGTLSVFPLLASTVDDSMWRLLHFIYVKFGEL